MSEAIAFTPPKTLEEDAKALGLTTSGQFISKQILSLATSLRELCEEVDGVPTGHPIIQDWKTLDKVAETIAPRMSKEDIYSVISVMVMIRDRHKTQDLIKEKSEPANE